MRIGVYSNWYKPVVNGVVHSICTFREELARQQHEVFVFAPQARGYADQDPRVIRYRALHFERPVPFSVAIRFSPAIDKLIPRLGLDVLHSQHPVILGSEAIRQGRRCHIPLVFTYHSYYETYASYVRWNQKALKSLAHDIVRRYLSACQCIIAPTASAREVIAQRYPEALARVVVLPTPINLSAYEQLAPESVRARYRLDGQFTFVVVARLSPEKGLTDLLAAFALVARQYADVRLLVIGDGPQRRILTLQAEALALRGRVIFTGQLPFEAVPQHLAAADAFAYASLCETQGLVLVEAMAAGLPVVAMDATASREVIVEGNNGLITRPNPEALAEGMLRIMGDSIWRQHLAMHARATASHYAAPEVARQLAQVYRATIAAYLR